LLTTLSKHRIHMPPGMCPENESYWSAVLLPACTGTFVIDLDWSENEVQRTQTVLCSADLAGVAGMHANLHAVLDVIYISPPRHDGTARDPPMRVNAIDVGSDPTKDFARVLLVRTPDGSWHACARHVDIERLDDRFRLLLIEPDRAA
jgi:hypothetical protein